MPPTSPPNPRKHLRSLSYDVDVPDSTQNVPPSRPKDHAAGSKRSRVEDEPASESTPADESPSLTVAERQSTAHRGHYYASSTVRDNGRMQMGDAFYHTGPASQLSGPEILNGNMNVHLTNIFYTCNPDLPRHGPAEDQERALKLLLYYDTMDDRKAQLIEAQPASLEWVWTTELPQWLENGENIFWISGKPASGKSTLMRYLSIDDHGSNRVLRHLQTHNKTWIVVHFYFDFRAGIGIANTGLGMLRSLLMQLVDNSVELRNYVQGRCLHRVDGRWPDSEPELIDLISTAVSSTNTSVCGFVDGLDEYASDLGKLFGILQQIHRIPSIKLCLASRPEPTIRFYLDDCSSFAMQDHNHGTISAYIEAAVTGLSKIVHVDQLQDMLTEEITRSANGVILWAVLAVDEVVKALLCGCTFTEIRNRLNLFPQGLASVYKRIWDRLGEAEQRWAAVILFIIEKWNSSFGRHSGAEIPLLSRYLTVLARWKIRDLDPNFVVEPEYTESFFRLKTYALLNGLVEFVGTKNKVRLVHRTVQSFLRELPEYIEWVSELSQMDEHVDVLGPKLFVDATLTLCDALVPEPVTFWNSIDHNLLDRPSIDRFIKYLYSHLIGLHRKKSIDCAVEVFDLVQDYLDYLWYDDYPSKFHVLDQEDMASLMVSMSQTWLIRDYLIPYYLVRYKLPFPGHFPSDNPMFEVLDRRFGLETLNSHSATPRSDLLNDYPELLYLGRYSFSHAFNAIARSGAGLTSTDCGLLFRIILRAWRVVKSSAVRELETQKRLIVPILSRFPWQAQFLIHLVLPEFKDVCVLEITKKSEDSAVDFFLRPSVWWPFEEIHVLCLWTWTRLERDDLLGQLDVLVDAGASLQHNVFHKGNVLHALFEYDPWHRFAVTGSKLAHPHTFTLAISSDSEFGHFSMAKFMALVRKGADIHALGGLHGTTTVRQAAEQFITMVEVRGGEDLIWRKASWQRTKNEVREAIAYIDAASQSSET